MTDTPEVRISPDHRYVAIRNHPSKWAQWSVTNGGHYHDKHVADWLPMVRLDVIPLEERQYHGEVDR